ncbi:MAG: hypothetical protein Q8S02_17770, partial [Hydrogenophaga sp.]|nr:hypothetical protein [Hydrogenophaga sp.]
MNAGAVGGFSVAERWQASVLSRLMVSDRPTAIHERRQFSSESESAWEQTMEEHDMEHEEHRRDLIDHSGLKVLLPYLKSYAQKGLTEMRSQKKSFTASVVEIYAAGVCERVS